jgi:tetraacyldisaccharide 4'-kinase
MLKAPKFWWKRRGVLAYALAPLAGLYGAVAKVRLSRPGEKVGVPVICIGNCVAGGAGKTPTALKIATWLQEHGKRPVFLSRGYGGSEAGPIRVDLASHTADEVGDEALLLARIAPTVIARDRLAGGQFAATLGNVIVMDDGLQNPALHKDVSLIVVDGAQGFGNGLCLPAGPLRAPLDAQFQRADLCLVIGSSIERGADGEPMIPMPVFHARIEVEEESLQGLRGNEALAFAGIGRPAKFFTTLNEAGIATPITREFPDHHRYTPNDLSALLDEAHSRSLRLATTAKDAVKLATLDAAAMEEINIVKVSLTIERAAEFFEVLSARLGFDP